MFINAWLEVMNEELDLIKKNDLWEITNLSSQRKVNGRIRVIRKKFKAKKKGHDKYKAKLVTKGFTQQPSLDFIDTYSPMVKFVLVRIIMFVVGKTDLKLHKLKVYSLSFVYPLLSY